MRLTHLISRLGRFGISMDGIDLSIAILSYNIILDYPNRFGLDRLLADKHLRIQFFQTAGLPVFKMLAKLYFDERDEENKEVIKVEYHKLEENHYCSGVHFVERPGGVDEDDGWLISYIHDEKENVSKVYIVDAKKFTESPISKITLPHRVPYGFHGTYVCK
ncbi:Carotenoid 9,10(9',10')-cleavage dioxygenase [Acorus calamus]|uniref:Carotenoid 9,10(9',10')-cleavage dioxygenase n=1 Tax=Acorus calamus TaxID=4465 RepID=A0AAV9EM03_ACOCL|nr:Carotenoid 9,10(9',10')-cleavage dioxygenase [Acorus calamus]